MKLTIDFTKENDKKKLWDTLKLLNAKYTVELTKFNTKRSLNANKYYWAVLRTIAKDTGNDEDDLHLYFKQRFLEPRKVIFKETGEEKEVVGNSSDLDSLVFFEYVEKVRIMAIQELNIYCPTPEEYINL